MNELITLINEEVVTTSLQVAEKFEKRHDRVLRAIDNVIANLDNLPKNGVVKIFKSSYTDLKGEKRPMYYMNRGAFELVAMGFTGLKAFEWKVKYIAAFEEMADRIGFIKADKQIQKNAMEFLQNNLEMPTRKDYCKANSIANKAVSNMFGFPKMVKKGDMTVEMLEQREPILNETVELMAVEDKYKLGISVSENIYKRHAMIE